MEVKSFTYRKNLFGTYYKQRLLNLQKMDNHIAKMLDDGWEVLTQTAHSGERRVLRPFAKRDTTTVSFRFVAEVSLADTYSSSPDPFALSRSLSFLRKSASVCHWINR